jgi:hypothetical protein
MGRYLDIAKRVSSGAEPRLKETLEDVAPASKAFKASKAPPPQGPAGEGVAIATASLLDPFDPPPAGRAPEWRRWLNLLVQSKEELGHPPTLAARLVYGEAMTIWHLQSGAKPDPRCCAGCGGPVAHPVHTLPGGAAVCPTDDCLITYGRKWRTAAAAALATLGIEAPEGWQP